MSSERVAIRVTQLEKGYQIYKTPRDRLKQFVMPRLRRVVKRPPRRYHEEFWALKDISFEIALKGQDGLDINDPSKIYHLRSLKGDFTALYLVCIMYAGFKEIAPGTDVGIDFSEEYAMAQKLFKPTGDT